MPSPVLWIKVTRSTQIKKLRFILSVELHGEQSTLRSLRRLLPAEKPTLVGLVPLLHAT